VRSKPKRSRDRDGLHHRVLLGYEQEEGDGTDKQAPDVSQRGESSRRPVASADWSSAS
jgi:hypothetical protein